MSSLHGVAGDFAVDAWTARSRTPPYYPDAVTLRPGVNATVLLSRIDTASPGATVKDSFADLDLGAAGFRVLFGAEWIHRSAAPPATRPALAWTLVRNPEQLRAWALAWANGAGNEDLFRPALLEDPDTFVVAGPAGDGQVVAGAVMNLSDQVVGVTNLFTVGGQPEGAWPGVLEAAYELFPGLPVVGYERGAGLRAAIGHGFEPTGSLRVWAHG